MPGRDSGLIFVCANVCGRTSTSLKKEKPTVPDPLTLSVSEQVTCTQSHPMRLVAKQLFTPERSARAPSLAVRYARTKGYPVDSPTSAGPAPPAAWPLDDVVRLQVCGRDGFRSGRLQKHEAHILRAAEFLKHHSLCGSVMIAHAKGVIMIADILNKGQKLALSSCSFSSCSMTTQRTAYNRAHGLVRF